MNIIIFGGSGFLGSHIADSAQCAGHTVTIFDKKPSPWPREGQRFIQGDIMDEKAVDAAMAGQQIAYNFAGIADIEMAARVPIETIRLNVLGNAILMDAARRADVGRFVFASSVYVYSNVGAFYRSSKRACEMFIEDYQQTFGLPYTILRYGTLYGPRSDDKNFIRCVISDALTVGRIERDGDGEEIREYIHVHDAARYSIDILAPEFENQIILLTGPYPMKVKDMLTMIREILNNRVEIEYKPAQSRFHYNITPYSYNPSLGRKYIGDSYIDLGQGILNLIEEIDAARMSSDQK